MAGNIRGITIDIGGNTQGLTDALRTVDGQAKGTQQELKQVERALKFDPGNTTLIAQQQQLLADSIENASTRLDALRNAQERVQQQFDSGDIGVEQYRLFQRELANSESSLRGLQGRLDATTSTQERFADAQQQLQTYLEATGQSVDDLASTLGSRLTNSIRDGSASADQLEAAIRRISQTSGNTIQNLERFQDVLRNSGNNNLDEVRRDLEQISDAAEEAERDVSGLGGAIAGVAAGLGAASIIEQALDVSSLNTQIDITLNLPEESRNAVRDSVKLLESFGIEREEALEGARRQFVLNGEAADSANQSTIRYAGSLAKAYSDIDFKELIQETNEISRGFKINNDEALGLVNSLLRIGFPPDQLDIIAEYGTQLIRAGFSAEQVQATFAAGVDTGTYNIDVLLDGLQEGRLRLNEFAFGVDDATKTLLASTNISASELQAYGQAIASGGAEGERAYLAVAQAVEGIADAQTREAVGVALFGTLYEQNGALVTQTLIGAQEQVVSLTENQRILNETTGGLLADPAIKLSESLGNLQTALQPVLEGIALLVGQIAQWASENIQLVAIIVSVVTTLGLLIATFALLSPAIGGLITALPLLTSLLAGIGAPILIVIGAIVALGVAFVTLYTQSEGFRDGVNEVFNNIKDVAVQVFETIAEFIGQQIQKIRDFWATDGQQVLEAAQNVFNGIQAVVEFVMPAILAVVEYVWDSIKMVIEGALDVILGIVKVFAGVFTGDFDKIWEGVKQIFSGAIELILGLLNLSFVGGIRKAVVNLAKTFASGIKGLVDDAVKKFNELKTKVLGTFEGFSLNQIGKDLVNGLINGIKSVANNAIAAARKVGEDVIQIFKDVFKTRSPSKITTAIGDDVGTGLANGISGTQAINKKATEDVGKVILEATNRNAKAIQDIDNKNEAERDKLRKAANDKIIKLQRDLSTSIGKVQADGTAKNAKAEKANDDKRANLRSANAIKISDIEKKLREDLIATNDKYYKQIVEQEAKLNAERLKSVEDYIASRKANNDLSLVDEAEYLRASYQQFATGSAENLKLQSAYRDSVKSINDAITRVNDDNLKETQRINSDLIKAEEDLNKNYEDTLNNRYNTLVNAYGLFDGVVRGERVEGSTLIDNLESQVRALQDFGNLIGELSDRGISDVLLEDLQNAGPKSLEQLKGLNRLTDSELLRYQEIYRDRSRLARETAIQELQPLQEQTQAQIIALRETANNELAQLNITWQQQINQVVRGTATQFSTLRQVGINAGQSLLDGLTSVQGALLATARDIADSINKTLADTLNVDLPSTIRTDFTTQAKNNLSSNIASSSERLNNALSNASASIGSSAKASLRNTQFNQQTINNQNNFDMVPVIDAINRLANTPVQPQLVVDGRNLTQVVSQYQRQDAAIQGLSRGVQFT